jgi:histone deacetylase 1/2
VNVLQQLAELPHAPSVQLQDVPRESLGAHLGFAHGVRGEESDGDDEEYDALDRRLAREWPA